MKNSEIIKDIEILETDTCYIKKYNKKLFYGIILASLILGLIAGMIISSIQTNFPFSEYTLITQVFFAVFGFVSSFYFTDAFAKDTGNVHFYEHKIRVGDSVTYNELIEKYEIINTKGKILTVREYVTKN